MVRLKSTGFAIIVAVAFVAFVGILAILAHRHAGPPHPDSAAIPQPSAAALPNGSWPPVAPPLVSTAVPLDARNTVEICGAGRFAVDPKEPLALYAKLSTMTDPRSAEWLKALLNSDDNRARAAGLMLQGKVAEGLQSQVMTDESRDALVQLAVGASDPAIYAMAIYACHTDRNPLPDGECPRLSLSTWAQMDTANAVPWLLLAQQARLRGDDVGAANAFARAAKAQKVDSYNYSLFAFADPERPKDTTPLEQLSFEVQVAGVESALQPLHATAALKYCTDEAMQDSTVLQQCNAVAELYVHKSTTLIDFIMGNTIGKRVGWPAERVNALNQEKFAMMEAQWEAGPSDDDPWSCSSVARGNAYWGQRLRLGELGASRETMAQTGETPEVLAKKLGERLSKYSEPIGLAPVSSPNQ